MRFSRSGDGYYIAKKSWLSEPVSKNYKARDLVSPYMARVYGADSLELMDQRIYDLMERMRMHAGDYIVNDWCYGGSYRYNGLSESYNDTHNITPLINGCAIIGVSRVEVAEVGFSIRQDLKALYKLGLRRYELCGKKFFIDMTETGDNEIQKIKGVLF